MDTAQAFNPTVSVPRDDDRDKNKLPPALVEAIRDDPAMVGPVARVYGATVLHDMFVASKSFTPAQQRDFVDLCARLGDMVPKQKVADSAGGGVSITINMPNRKKEPITVEGTAIELPEEADARD